MKPRWYRGWPPRLILLVSLFIAVVTLFSILAVVWTLQTVYHDDCPLFRANLKVEEITSLKLVYLANSQDLERLGLYAIMNTSDYDEVILELNEIDYRVESPLTKDIVDTRCFHVETTTGTTWLLCERGYFVIDEAGISTGILRTPDAWSAFDSLWKRCIDNRIESTN